MEVDYKAIGQRIKIARIKKGVTQETVADLIDITPAHMSNVETGKTKVSLHPRMNAPSPVEKVSRSVFSRVIKIYIIFLIVRK